MPDGNKRHILDEAIIDSLPALTIGCQALDRVRPLMTARVGLPGYRLEFPALSPAQIAREAFERGTLAVAQVSPCHFLRYLDAGGRDYVGLPIPIARSFRHSGIYVREGSGITDPRQLNGTTIGCPDIMATTHIWQKGLLQDDYGVDLDSLSCVVGKVDPELTSWTRPPAAMMERGAARICDGSETLVDLLHAGEISALLTLRRPRDFIDKRGLVRLFPDYQQAQAEYWRRYGVLPITQMMVLRRSELDRDPDLPARLTAIFTAAKNIAIEELREASYYYVSLPLLPDLVEQSEAMFGEDFWPYGIETCTRTMEPFARYCHEQGLTGQRLSMRDIFPDFID